MTQQPDTSPLTQWWSTADEDTRQRARDAGYYEAAGSLPSHLAAALSKAGVHPAAIGHFTGASSGPDGLRLSTDDVDTLRALDGAAPLD